MPIEIREMVIKINASEKSGQATAAVSPDSVKEELIEQMSKLIKDKDER